MVLVKVLKGLLLSLYTKVTKQEKLKKVIKRETISFGKFVICIDNNKERGEIEDGFGRKIFINIEEKIDQISPHWILLVTDNNMIDVYQCE